jgi:hypothetical protein
MFHELRCRLDPGQMALLGPDRNPDVMLDQNFVRQDSLQPGNATLSETEGLLYQEIDITPCVEPKQSRYRGLLQSF